MGSNRLLLTRALRRRLPNAVISEAANGEAAVQAVLATLPSPIVGDECGVGAAYRGSPAAGGGGGGLPSPKLGHDAAALHSRSTVGGGSGASGRGGGGGGDSVLVSLEDATAGGHSVRGGGSGRQPPYDVICMDKEMPGVDGYAATRRIRAAGYRGVIVGVTANAFADDVRDFIACGLNGVVTKPVDMATLMEFIHGAAPSPAVPAHSAASVIGLRASASAAYSGTTDGGGSAVASASGCAYGPCGEAVVHP